MKISLSSIFPQTPCPVIDIKSFTGGSLIPLSLASSTIASPKGCSECSSKAAATCKISSSFKFFTDIISVTLGFPSVIVPVLSKTIVSTLCAFSRASPDLISIPSSAPLPVPTIIAVGVASPNEHGQAITITDINIVRENIAGVSFISTIPLLPK